MQKPPAPLQSTPDAASRPAVGPAPADIALARRRVLLQGLGKGTAVAASLVPLQTLATPFINDGTKRLCTVSGIQSNVGSGRRSTGTTDLCQGHGAGFYSTLSNWPGYDSATLKATNTVNGRTFEQTAAFSAVFADPGATTTPLLTLVTTAPASPEAVWTVALLNSLKRPGPTNIGSLGYFPYTPSEVMALYADPLKREDARFFFAGYLQQL